MDKTVEKATGIFKQLTPAEIKFVEKTGLAPSGFSGKLTKEETELLVYYCSHPLLTTFCLKILEEEKGERAARLSEAIKIEIKRGHEENSYSLTMGDSTAHDISMDEALRLVKEEMEKLREGEGVEETVCTMCGRTFESVKGRITLTCSEACSQKWTESLGRLIREIIEFRERSAKRWESIEEQLR